MSDVNQIGVIAIELGTMKQTLRSFINLWKSQYTSNLLQIARDDLNTLVDYMGANTRKFNMTVSSLDDVRKANLTLTPPQVSSLDDDSRLQ